MGDRANAKVVDGSESVHLYTHSSGYELPETIKSGLIRGKGRWDDPQYLTRILFCEMVKGRVMEETGFGISVGVGDGSERVLEVNCDKQAVIYPDNRTYSFTEFTEMDKAPNW